ncbi:hypothetical protein BDW02DRAFT_573269 [Decorospora gaudefroyi]|uniref:Uncharacterized protein n=1 Tax=Decorospora gaudefroyi TaxID=184978 RepID=A0A6A5JYZ7_9PLEO|nr:hypothetical protein BDW02DRAFT_573269 [Decorospora gaudefroyi]
MAASVVTTNLFLALIVLTSTILILILVYLLVRFINRHKVKICEHQHPTPSVDLEDGRCTRLSDRLSRQQIQQEHYEDLQRRYSSVPPSPSIELLPEIKTSSCDDRASEWLERGKIDDDEGVGEKRPKPPQVLGAKPEKKLRWDWRDEKMGGEEGSPKRIESTDGNGMVCKEYEAEKPKADGT